MRDTIQDENKRNAKTNEERSENEETFSPKKLIPLVSYFNTFSFAFFPLKKVKEV